MTAGALAGELQLPLFIIRLDSLITKFMGETAAKLRLVFEAMTSSRGVYLFDEFDSIGAQRALPNEVGEIRRVLNSFLQCIEQDTSDSLSSRQLTIRTCSIGPYSGVLTMSLSIISPIHTQCYKRSKRSSRALPKRILHGSRWQNLPQDAAMLTLRVHAKTPPKRWS